MVGEDFKRIIYLAPKAEDILLLNLDRLYKKSRELNLPVNFLHNGR